MSHKGTYVKSLARVQLNNANARQGPIRYQARKPARSQVRERLTRLLMDLWTNSQTCSDNPSRPSIRPMPVDNPGRNGRIGGIFRTLLRAYAHEGESWKYAISVLYVLYNVLFLYGIR